MMLQSAKSNRLAMALIVVVFSGTFALAQRDSPRTVDATTPAARAPVKIVLVGDSTVNAEGGWGKGFCGLMTPNVTCVNEALNGRSSKSFIDEGAWTKALADKATTTSSSSATTT
jgi:hypothetical protein